MKSKSSRKREIESYSHDDQQRLNNPPIGLAKALTEDEQQRKTYEFDPHFDPELNWTGKAERTSFDVPSVPLHVHERIDPKTILKSVEPAESKADSQPSLFENEDLELSMSRQLEFYQHRKNWSNRLIAGDSLLVMNSLLEKEGMAEQVQMIYFDPPYGIKYKSNYQPFVGKKEVSEQEKDITHQPEVIRAFRDTWELGIHSYLSYMRDRLLLAKQLLTESGSIFVQIGDENLHRVSLLLDEVFGSSNRVATITFATTSGSSTSQLPEVADYLLWYASDKSILKYSQLYEKLDPVGLIDFFSSYARVQLEDGSCRKLEDLERVNPSKYLPKGARLFKNYSLESQGRSTTGRSEPYVLNGKEVNCSINRQWSVSHEAIDLLVKHGRIYTESDARSLFWKKYEDEVPGRRINNIWPDQTFPSGNQKVYAVQTAIKTIEKCILMATSPGDLVFDPTCGSGTTAYCAEKWGRRWITCDTSRVATITAKKRLMNSNFVYFKLAYPNEGVSSDFEYESVPDVSPKILAGLAPQSEIKLVDRPKEDKLKRRVTGPFTVEAVPAPTVSPISDSEITTKHTADSSVANSNPTQNINRWVDELLASGVRGTDGQKMLFASLEPAAGSLFIHAIGELKPTNIGDPTDRIVVVFGPDHSPLTKTMVERAIQDAELLKPSPKYILFSAFHFDAHASKEISDINWPGITLLKSQMNTDLLTEDLRKKQRSSESFWLFGEPDAEVSQFEDGFGDIRYVAKVKGFDYYNTESGEVESGDLSKIAMWMLDTDYDGRSLFPQQVFYPNSDNDGWKQLAKNLKGSVDQELIKEFKSGESLPFSAGEYKRVAIKIVDDRGIESLKIISLDEGWSDSRANQSALVQAKSPDGTTLSVEEQEKHAIDSLVQPTDGSEMPDYYLRQQVLETHANG